MLSMQTKVFEIESHFEQEFERLCTQYEAGEIGADEFLTYRRMVTEFITSLEKMWTYLSE